jgi:2-polyprenyl-3-methyl-5-hydroxy-6-metoxy-1,4-benzoquinol methylase
MNLKQIFDSHDGRLIDKWEHYFPIYERYFRKFRDAPCRVLEIGVCHGGSLQMWKKYFHVGQIVGVDIDQRCLNYAEDRISIVQADQADARSMERIGKDFGPFDIIIDDGSHVIAHQEISARALWPYLKDGGVYLIEDCHQGYPFFVSQNVAFYPWVVVAEKNDPMPVGKRIIAGKPSRPLNDDEKAVYGDLK